MMLFSIIVPVHNGQKYIKSSVESVIHQDYSGDYEIIIVENGSTDDTAAIVDTLAGENENITALHLGPIGLYAARQEGIKRATGDYIVALDSDDEADPSLLSELSGIIQDLDKKGQRADIIYFDVADLDHRSTKMFNHPLEAGRLYEGEDKMAFYKLLCEGDSINSMWSKCVRRDIAYLGREELYLNFGEDLYQTAEYLDRARGILYLDRILYYYRQNDVSISSSYSEVYMENQKLVWSKLDEMSAKWDVDRAESMLWKRKSLTCAIAVGKLVCSSLGFGAKKKKLKALMKDEFYQEYYLHELPSWAPEADSFYHYLMCGDNPYRDLTANAFKIGIKTAVKRIAGR